MTILRLIPAELMVYKSYTNPFHTTCVSKVTWYQRTVVVPSILERKKWLVYEKCQTKIIECQQIIKATLKKREYNKIDEDKMIEIN